MKICANTSAEDALLAAEFGADAVGFVFAPSVRRVTPRQVRSISFVLPEPLERVGVFAEGTAHQIAEAAVEARLNAIQLHGGNLAPEFLDSLRRLLSPEVALIPVLHWSTSPDTESEQVKTALRALAHLPAGTRTLIDSKVGKLSGGTGQAFKWDSAREVFSGPTPLRLILAGGLTAHNVAEAIQLLCPEGVDVASGVEAVPGRKDRDRLRTFIHNARNA